MAAHPVIHGRSPRQAFTLPVHHGLHKITTRLTHGLVVFSLLLPGTTAMLGTVGEAGQLNEGVTVAHPQKSVPGSEALQAPEPPPNDDFNDALPIDVLPYTSTVDTTMASVAGDDPSMSCIPTGFPSGLGEPTHTVWYKYETPLDMGLEIDTTQSLYPTMVVVWTGTRGSLIEVACHVSLTSIPEPLVVNLAGGNTYWIEIASLIGLGGELVFEVEYIPALTNDELDGAIPMSLPSIFAADNRLATTAADDPSPSCGANSPAQQTHSVWFTYTPTEDHLLALMQSFSTFVPVISIYTGVRGSLIEVACSTTASVFDPLVLQVTTDETYWIEVTEFGDGPGGATLIRIRDFPSSTCSDGTCTFVIGNRSDDAGPAPANLECPESTDRNEIYLGQCNDATGITSGFRFNDIPIPNGATIERAHLEFVSDGPYTIGLDLSIYGEATGNATTFGDDNWPYQRSPTVSSSEWVVPPSEVWNLGETHQTTDFSDVVQEIVNRGDWSEGNALAVLVTNNNPTDPPNEHRRLLAFERAMNSGYYSPPTLVVEFTPPPPDQPDLSLDLNAASAAAPGDRLTYNLTLRNLGAGSSTEVNLTLNLPPEVSYVQQNSPVAPIVQGTTLNWSFEDMAAGEAQTILIQTDINPNAAIGSVLTADASASTADELNPSDNSDTTTTTLKAAYAYNANLTPSSIQINMGQQANFRVQLRNLGLRADTYSLEVTGIASAWIPPSTGTLTLGAGGAGAIDFSVAPPDCQPDSTIPFNVTMTAQNSSDTYVLDGLLTLIQAPRLILEAPGNTATLGARTALLRWRTIPATIGVVTVDGPDGIQIFTTDLGTSHAVEVPDLTRNETYEWTVEATSTCGTASASRSFKIGNGIVFNNRNPAYALIRDYDQRFQVTVRNQDVFEHTLTTTIDNPYEDLIVNFIGSGSIDEMVTLAPGETRQVTLAVHAQDAEQRYYGLTAQLVADEGTGIPIEDSAAIKLDILAEGDFTIVENEAAFDPLTLGSTYVVTNHGRTISDLTLRAVDPGTGLPARIFLQPAVQHARLETNKSLTVVAYPIFGPEDLVAYTPGNTAFVMSPKSAPEPIEYEIEGTGAGETVTEGGIAACPPGKQIYAVKVSNAVWQAFSNGWYCTNKPQLVMIMEALSNFLQSGIDAIEMSLTFSPKGNEVQPHSGSVSFNGTEVGNFEDAIPEGELIFNVPVEAWNEGEAGMVQQVIEVLTQHENPGHYMVAANPTISVSIEEATFYVCASSQEEAEAIVQETLELQPLPEDVSIYVIWPIEGTTVQPDSQGRVEIEARLDTDLGVVYDYFIIDGTVEYLDAVGVEPDDIVFFHDGGPEDQYFQTQWNPKAGGRVRVTARASIFGQARATNTQTFSVDALPDFEITKVYQDPHGLRSGYLTVRAELENLGTAVQGPISVDFRYYKIDTDTGLPTGDPLWISSKTIFDGEVFQSGGRITITDSKSVGSELEIYFVEVLVDP